MRAGRYDEAITLQKRAISRLEGVSGDDHLRTIGALNNLGYTLTLAGRFDEAHECYDEALDRLVRTIGEDD